MKVYIAISIHGTSTFLRATREIRHLRYQDVHTNGQVLMIGGRKFLTAASSVPRVTQRGNSPVKVILPDLARDATRSTSGKGPQSINQPVVILQMFQLLVREGWVIDIKSVIEFARYHKVNTYVDAPDLHMIIRAYEDTRP
jgi:hypothetical protein